VGVRDGLIAKKLVDLAPITSGPCMHDCDGYGVGANGLVNRAPITSTAPLHYKPQIIHSLPITIGVGTSFSASGFIISYPLNTFFSLSERRKR
jgi:hypothetical protein